VPGASTYHCEWAWLGGATAVTAGVGEPPPGATRRRGLTVPGFANAHSHAFHRVLRGRTHGGRRGSFWTWRDEMYGAAAALDPEGYHRLARAVYAEMALAGITTVGEFHYLHHQPDGTPYDDPNAMAAALVAAARDVGIRLTLLDACYLQGGIATGPNGVAAARLDGVQRRFGDGDGDAWAARVEQLRDADDVRIGAAIHSVRAVDPKTMELVAAWAAERAAPLHAHVSEQPAENEQCLAAYGRAPVALLADHGVLSDRFTAVHATHLAGGDVEQLGAASATCCFCPTTERDLADGIGPARALVDAGARLCLGSDSHAVIDPLEEARAVELHERLAAGARGYHDPAALLTMATAAGHVSLGWPAAGRLAPGAPADLVTIGADSVRTAGLGRDPLGIAVFAAGAGDITHVIASGRVIVADGHHVRIDTVAELEGVL
jgi:formiminoglutamate deiminase